MSDPGAGVEWVDTAEEVVVVVTENRLPAVDATAAGRLEVRGRAGSVYEPGSLACFRGLVDDGSFCWTLFVLLLPSCVVCCYYPCLVLFLFVPLPLITHTQLFRIIQE